jgi:hypothetical protein
MKLQQVQTATADGCEDEIRLGIDEDAHLEHKWRNLCGNFRRRFDGNMARAGRIKHEAKRIGAGIGGGSRVVRICDTANFNFQVQFGAKCGTSSLKKPVVICFAVQRIFLLSPARSSGKRADMLISERAQFDLARRLRLKKVPLGEVFTFLSRLYFRGKIAYARTFAQPPAGLPGVFVITTNRGLLDADTLVNLDQFKKFSEVDIDGKDPRYREPLIRTARRLAAKMNSSGEVILLGSIATGKYVDVLAEVFCERLLFPVDFVGRGDMSRGGLMLRCAADGCELAYASVLGAIRHGARPQKLVPRRYS